MTSIVLLVGQLGIVLGGFMGMSSLVSWYNKGGEKHGNPNNNKHSIRTKD